MTTLKFAGCVPNVGRLKWQQAAISNIINYYFKYYKPQILSKQNWLQFSLL